MFLWPKTYQHCSGKIGGAPDDFPEHHSLDLQEQKNGSGDSTAEIFSACQYMGSIANVMEGEDSLIHIQENP